MSAVATSAQRAAAVVARIRANWSDVLRINGDASRQVVRFKRRRQAKEVAAAAKRAAIAARRGR